MCSRYDLALVGVVQDPSVLLAAVRDTLKEESKKELQDAKDTTFPLTTAIIGLLRMASWQLMGSLVPAIFHAPTRRVMGISPEKEKWLQVHRVTVAFIAALLGLYECVFAVPIEKLLPWFIPPPLQALFGHFFKGLIDHLVLNHKQLLSMERENHKVQSINVPVDGKSFVWSQYPCEA
jgi:hypothetical protein